jgi:hypothetical protein
LVRYGFISKNSGELFTQQLGAKATFSSKWKVTHWSQ